MATRKRIRMTVTVSVPASTTAAEARRESEKADDEARAHKVENLRLRAAGSREDYALIKQFQRRAEIAEAALKATQP